MRCAQLFPHVSSGDLNTGGIVAGVIVALLLLALLGFGIWYANKKGYLPSEFSLSAWMLLIWQVTIETGCGEVKLL